ncbi:hypothetical protein Cst_c07500 [Thermoclostridium stercorarium subsp. stercorarium DSM 8532]|jgi:hypothetical protein|uniref:Uncharacterized protein n=1 Tax=Thermoclostridium stercorarium (strain ATCC 35414 / DSM 8532 / NCIMB 11754) TaxID=1121335 RepID=L7VM95_THES1|nr:hypothetical protein Cst_c07500 [Thermoclostridium stercorarium subsp. stercorarium DSM 8532]
MPFFGTVNMKRDGITGDNRFKKAKRKEEWIWAVAEDFT